MLKIIKTAIRKSAATRFLNKTVFLVKFLLMKKIYTVLIAFCSVLGYAQSVSLYTPPSGAAYGAEQYFCMGEKFNLKVDAVATSTGDYSITQPQITITPPANNIPFSNKVGNDHFSRPIPIPFTFEFYGKQYTELVVGSNGRLLFGSGTDFANLHTNRYVDKMHSGNDATSTNIKIPNDAYNQIDSNDFTRSLNFAQIFFGYTDIGYYDPNYYDKLKYGNVTYNGVAGLSISFDKVLERTAAGGYSATITSQVVIFADNSIIIRVVKADSSKNAIIGVQNDDGTLGRWPPDSGPTSPYNNGKWSDNGAKSWVLTPSQNLTPQFKWFRNGVQIPGENGDTLNNFTPNAGDILRIDVTYHDPSGTQVGAVASDQVKFNLLQNPQISAPNYAAGCGSPAELHVISPDPNLVYEWRSDTDAGFSQTGTSILVGNGSYYVQVRNTAGTCIVKSASQVVNISSSLPIFVHEDQTLKFCDNADQPSRVFDLATVTGYPIGSDYTIEYFEAGSSTPITTATVLSGQTKLFSIKVTTNAGVSPFCTFTKNFSIAYLSFPPNNKVYTSAKLCDDVNSYTAAQFKAEYFTGSTFQIQFSTDGTTFSASPVNPQTSVSVWVKITDPNFTCQSIVKLNFDFHPPVQANTPATQLPPQCANGTETFDLASLIPEINADPNVTVSFHRSLPDAQSGNNPVSLNFRGGIGTTTLYIRVVNNVTGCVAQNNPDISFLVYSKPTLLKSNVSLTNCQGNTVFDLTQNVSDLVNADPAVTVTLQYYSPSGALLTAAQVAAYDESVYGAAPYIKVVYNPTCSDVVSFNLNYNPKPVSLISQIPVCGETTYALQDFKDKAIANESQHTFTDEFGNPLPNSFNLAALPLTVRFYIKNNSTGCVSDLQSITFAQGTPTSILSNETDYELCDEDFDGKTSFNLDSKKAVFSADPAAVFEYFKDAAFTENIPSNYANEIPLAQTVYVRITSPGQCPVSAKINLKVKTPERSSTLVDKYFICYGETLAIDAGSENSIFSWSDGQTAQVAHFTAPGTYSVVLKNGPNGCPYTHSFIVSDENQPKIEVVNQTSNSIEVVASGGSQPYRYYFNGIQQSSNILMNPTAPYYEIQVQSATGCFGPPKTVYFIKIHNAFTPNGDGKNDVWKIENLDKMENVSLVIVDRFGNKVFESQNKDKVEWDGTSGGRKVPSSTYWYTLTFYDAVTQKAEQRQGWILLKNRN